MSERDDSYMAEIDRLEGERDVWHDEATRLRISRDTSVSRLRDEAARLRGEIANAKAFVYNITPGTSATTIEVDQKDTLDEQIESLRVRQKAEVEKLRAESLALTATINGLLLPAVHFDGYPIETAIERLRSQYSELARAVWALPADEPLTTSHAENVAEAIRDTLRAAEAAKEE